MCSEYTFSLITVVWPGLLIIFFIVVIILALKDREDTMKKRSITSLVAATLVAVTLFWMIPAGKVSAADKKISDIFADKNLQAWVKENVDSNKDGQLSQTEINNVTEVSVKNKSIRNMTGITVFKNLKKLDCSYNELTKLEIINLALLTDVDCSHNQLTVFNAKGCTNLEVLNCSSNKLEGFNVSNSLLLKKVDISYNNFTYINWGNKRTKMEVFDCSNNKMTDMKINGLAALTNLNCSWNLLDSIDISGLDNLSSLFCRDVKNVDISNSNVTQLSCGGSRLESLKLSDKIQDFSMWNTDKIKELDLRDCKELKSISCSSNELESLNVYGLEKLVTLSCTSNKLISLTLGKNTKLQNVLCENNKLKDLKVDEDIRYLHCEENPLEYLDISGSDKLREAAVNMVYYGPNQEYQLYFGRASDVYYEFKVDNGVKIITEAKSEEPKNNNQGSSDQEPSGESGNLIKGFVERLYTCVLGRDAETDGLNFWTTDLYNFKVTGTQVAQGFIFSQEFKDRNTSNEDFVKILYKTFFDREPETDGFNYWVGLLKSGTSRETVANGFIFSQEWADTCAVYGIRSGCDIKSKVNIKPTDLTYAFVERLYVKAFNRDFDAEGREYWANLLSNYNITGEQAGASFFLSKEMADYNLSNEEFVNRLYSTFMDREGEKDGVDYWVGLLKGGASRESVVYGFTRSPEFTEKCIVARILPY